jgi:hypothetical protein
LPNTPLVTSKKTPDPLSSREPRDTQNGSSQNKRWPTVLFLAGWLLIAVNLAGFFIPIRDVGIYTELRNGFRDDILLTEKEFYQRIERHGESDAEFARKVTEAVSHGIAHNNMYRYRKMPFYRNYLLALSRHALFVWRWARGTLNDPNKPPVYHYIFSDWRKAVARGVGLCAQQSDIVAGILTENHIPSKIMSLGGHVVASGEIDQEGKTWWILDPDYGVVIPHDLHTIENQPSLIRPYYAAKGYDAATINHLEGFFAPPNLVHDSIAESHGRLRYYFEFASYYLIWIIPPILMLPFLIRCRRS